MPTDFNNDRLRAFLMQVGIENVFCRVHSQKMADALTRTVEGKGITQYFCDAWTKLPQLNSCIFVEKSNNAN